MDKTRGFEEVKEEFKREEKTIFPIRSTEHSAGYDFFNNTGKDISIKSKESFKWFTNIKAYMQNDEYLEIVPRSSIGTKFNLMLANTIGICDSDYYSNPDNDGNIGISLYNYGKADVLIKAGDRVVQAIFKKYLIADNCNSENQRVGGFGSTN